MLNITSACFESLFTVQRFIFWLLSEPNPARERQVAGGLGRQRKNLPLAESAASGYSPTHVGIPIFPQHQIPACARSTVTANWLWCCFAA